MRRKLLGKDHLISESEKRERIQLRRMDAILCDELLEDIFHRLPPPSSAAASLVCKRWLRLSRSSKTRLTLHLCPYDWSTFPRLSSFISYFPLLSSLCLHTAGIADHLFFSTAFSDRLLLSIASSCPSLCHLQVFTGAVSALSLLSLSTSCPNLISLRTGLSRPYSFHWIVLFRSLKDLSIVFSGVEGEFDSDYFNSISQHSDDELQLESLSLYGIHPDDCDVDWLWRSCKRLKKLQLRTCEGLGVDSSASSFVKCLKGLQEVELRTCRTIADEVLLKLAENCASLKTLLIYDGGSREGLLRFISQRRCNLQKLDLRLPLDLGNEHLMAVAENYWGLTSLRLQSCFLVTGEGLKTVGAAIGNELEELALINIDVVEREPGLLATLGQNMRKLRKLDLSYNEMLSDIEFTSMLVSCSNLIELKLRGCKGLTNLAMVSMSKSCRNLEYVNMTQCCGIQAEAVEKFIMNSRRLRRMQVEENKLSDVARRWVSNKFIEMVFD